MFFKVVITLTVALCAVYYLICMLQVFKVIRFTPPHVDIKFPKMLIPFYYFFNNSK